MSRRVYNYDSSHISLEFEQDECPALIISEADFTEHPLYVYLSPAEAAAEFRKVADWLDGVQKAEDGQ